MSVNTRFSTAVHVLAVLGYLEKQGVDLVSSGMIARSVNTNAVVIRNLIRALKKAGLVNSKEGKGGGVFLTKTPAKISLQEIYAAVEREGVLTASQKPKVAACPVSCGMKKVFDAVSEEVDGAVAKVLRGKSLRNVLEDLR